MLSMKPENVPQGISKLQEELAAQGERLKVQTARLYELLAPQILAQADTDEDGIKYVAVAQEDCSAADAKLLLNKLLAGERTVAAVVYRSGERVNYVLGCGSGTGADCRVLCQLQESCSAARAEARKALPRAAVPIAKSGSSRCVIYKNH